jgi:hypothetical protein
LLARRTRAAQVARDESEDVFYRDACARADMSWTDTQFDTDPKQLATWAAFRNRIFSIVTESLSFKFTGAGFNGRSTCCSNNTVSIDSAASNGAGIDPRANHPRAQQQQPDAFR